jgi:hypothetical protein
MKTKKLVKKLVLNKKTITDFNNLEMEKIQAGGHPPIHVDTKDSVCITLCEGVHVGC